MVTAERGVKYDDLTSRDADWSSIFLAFNQPLPESKSILRRCIQCSNSNEHSDPWWIRRQRSFDQSFHRILLSMFDFSHPRSPLDQGRRDPIRSDLLVVTMKRRRKKDVALLPMCRMANDFALFRLSWKWRERNVKWLDSYMTIDGRKSSVAPLSRSRKEAPLRV
ncbi:hypothetical protein Ancab_032183 [Ancistrocladus abbreviatus]